MISLRKELRRGRQAYKSPDSKQSRQRRRNADNNIKAKDEESNSLTIKLRHKDNQEDSFIKTLMTVRKAKMIHKFKNVKHKTIFKEKK
jgi:hypothetical protein